MKAEIHKMKSQIEEINTQISEMKKGREETDERSALLSEMAEKDAFRQKNESELEVYKDMDPDLFEIKSFIMWL